MGPNIYSATPIRRVAGDEVVPDGGGGEGRLEGAGTGPVASHPIALDECRTTRGLDRGEATGVLNREPAQDRRLIRAGVYRDDRPRLVPVDDWKVLGNSQDCGGGCPLGL